MQWVVSEHFMGVVKDARERYEILIAKSRRREIRRQQRYVKRREMIRSRQNSEGLKTP